MSIKDPCKTCTPKKMAEEGCCANNLGFGTKILRNKFRKIEVCRYLTKLDDDSWGCGLTEDRQRPPECAAYSCEAKLLSSW